MKKAIIIIIWAIFVSICLSNSVHGQLINKKPEVKPDTCMGASINVLFNDNDPNGDRMRLTKFNNISFVEKLTFEKSDTGAFTVDSGGRVSFTPDPSFYGQITLSYYVNDGKSGPGRYSTVTFIRGGNTTLNKNGFGYEISYNDSCRYHTGQPKYWVKLYEAGDTFHAYIFKESLVLRDSVYTNRFMYGLAYKTDKIPVTSKDYQIWRWYITEETFYFIKQHACLK